MLLVDPDDGRLARVALGLREEGFKVVALSRPEAAVPLFGAFGPDAVVIAVRPEDGVPVPIARRLRQLSRGTVPLTYLVAPEQGELRRACLQKGLGLSVMRPDAEPAELAARLRSQLRFQENLLERARASLDAQNAELRDPLTGVASRRYLLGLVEEEMKRAERHGGAFTVVAAALTGHGAFRRAFGRATADRLVGWAAGLLQTSVRDSDVVARMGASEFALLLPHTPSESVAPLLGRLRARLELARLEVSGRAFRLEVAFGAASFPDERGAAGQLVGAAFRELRRELGPRDDADGRLLLA